MYTKEHHVGSISMQLLTFKLLTNTDVFFFFFKIFNAKAYRWTKDSNELISECLP